MMEHNFKYFNQFKRLLQHFILFETQSNWESKGFLDEKIMPPFTASKIHSSKLVQYNSRIKLRFKVGCLKQDDKAAFTAKNVLNFLLFMN